MASYLVLLRGSFICGTQAALQKHPKQTEKRVLLSMWAQLPGKFHSAETSHHHFFNQPWLRKTSTGGGKQPVSKSHFSTSSQSSSAHRLTKTWVFCSLTSKTCMLCLTLSSTNSKPSAKDNSREVPPAPPRLWLCSPFQAPIHGKSQPHAAHNCA